MITETQWIGINTELLTGEVRAGTIGTNTGLLTEIEGETKWIGINTEYITEVVQTTTISGLPTTVTSLPNFQIIGSVDEHGNPTGSLMAPALAAQVQKLADELCTKNGDEEGSCSADFVPRIQTLLTNGNKILHGRQDPVTRAVTAEVLYIAWAVSNLLMPRSIYSVHFQLQGLSISKQSNR